MIIPYLFQVLVSTMGLFRDGYQQPHSGYRFKNISTILQITKLHQSIKIVAIEDKERPTRRPNRYDTINTLFINLFSEVDLVSLSTGVTSPE